MNGVEASFIEAGVFLQPSPAFCITHTRWLLPKPPPLFQIPFSQSKNSKKKEVKATLTRINSLPPHITATRSSWISFFLALCSNSLFQCQVWAARQDKSQSIKSVNARKKNSKRGKFHRKMTSERDHPGSAGGVSSPELPHRLGPASARYRPAQLLVPSAHTWQYYLRQNK